MSACRVSSAGVFQQSNSTDLCAQDREEEYKRLLQNERALADSLRAELEE